MAINQTDSPSDVKDEIASFLKKNFPQIEMHSGDAVVESVDLESKEARIQLGGACDGCGVSPMTIEAIKKRLPKDITQINSVDVDTGEDDSEEEEEELPFG